MVYKMRTCIVCGEPFEPRTGNAKFCPGGCRRKRNRKYGREYMRHYRAAMTEEERKRERECARGAVRRSRTYYPERWMLAAARKRAKKAEIECSIMVEDIVIPDCCPIDGKPIQRGKEGFNDRSPSLDRIDSSRGYVPGNVAVISWRMNGLKSNGALQEFEQIAAYMRGYGVS